MWNVGCWLQRVLLINDDPNTSWVGERVLLFIKTGRLVGRSYCFGLSRVLNWRCCSSVTIPPANTPRHYEQEQYNEGDYEGFFTHQYIKYSSHPLAVLSLVNVYYLVYDKDS